MLATLAAAVSLLAPSPVSALAADGHRVAVASGCEVRIWTPATRRATRVGRHRCEATSTGSGIATVALAGNRALWLQYAGGNIRDWTLWTATTTRPVPRRLAFASRDVDAPPPIVLGEGDRSRLGDLLPYAVGSTVVALRSNGSRAFRWTAPARVTALGAGGGEVVVGAADGSVTVLDARGGLLRATSAHGTAPSAAFVSGSRTVAQRGRVVEVSGGDGDSTFTLPAGARVVDAHGSAVAYVRGGVVHRVDALTGADRVLRRGAFAQLEPAWIVTARGRAVTATSA